MRILHEVLLLKTNIEREERSTCLSLHDSYRQEMQDIITILLIFIFLCASVG